MHHWILSMGHVLNIDIVVRMYLLKVGPFDIWGRGGVEENMEINKLFPILLKINKLFPSLLEISRLFFKLPKKMDCSPQKQLVCRPNSSKYFGRLTAT